MENREKLTDRIKKSGQGLSDHGLRVLAGADGAGRELRTFVQDEAKGWGEYLKSQYKHIEAQSREVLKAGEGAAGHRDAMKARVDALITKVKGWKAPADIAAEPPTEPDQGSSSPESASSSASS
jgi:hypothetical protein